MQPTDAAFTWGRFRATAAWHLARATMWVAAGFFMLFRIHQKGAAILAVTTLFFCVGIFFVFYPFYLYFRWEEENKKWKAIVGVWGFFPSYAELWKENKRHAIIVAFSLLFHPIIVIVLLVAILVMD
ncbi:MAG: hypothetical protein JSV08_03240 [Acidobacteriota bacterium]|nr:MAG: hypothetical protein JSV08_03240 [Acidobacteriota bacterium]